MALSDLNRALELDLGLTMVYFHRSAIYLRQEQYDLALADFNKILEIYPNSTYAYYNRSLIYYRIKGDMQRALNDALKAKQLGYKVEDNYIRFLQNSLK